MNDLQHFYYLCMKKQKLLLMNTLKWVFITFFTTSSFLLQAGVITMTGYYKGQNIFIQNPFDASTKQFCIVSIYVNKYGLRFTLWYCSVTITFSTFFWLLVVTLSVIRCRASEYHRRVRHVHNLYL